MSLVQHRERHDAMMAPAGGYAMERISRGERIVLRAGVLVAILLILWVLGLVKTGPVLLN
jgi:hypothetical protein